MSINSFTHFKMFHTDNLWHFQLLSIYYCGNVGIYEINLHSYNRPNIINT